MSAELILLGLGILAIAGIITAFLGAAGSALGKFVKARTEWDWADEAINNTVFWLKENKSQIAGYAPGDYQKLVESGIENFFVRYVAEYGHLPGPEIKDKARRQITEKVEGEKVFEK